jgi:hypothetical protein
VLYTTFRKSTLEHAGRMWQIHCYINVYVHLVGIFEELSMNVQNRKLKKIHEK